MSALPIKTMDELWPVAVHEAGHYVVAKILLAELHGWTGTEPWVSRGATPAGEYGRSDWIGPGGRQEPMEDELADFVCFLAAGGAACHLWGFAPGDDRDREIADGFGATDDGWRSARERADALVRRHRDEIEAKARQIWETEREIQEGASGGS